MLHSQQPDKLVAWGSSLEPRLTVAKLGFTVLFVASPCQKAAMASQLMLVSGPHCSRELVRHEVDIFKHVIGLMEPQPPQALRDIKRFYVLLVDSPSVIFVLVVPLVDLFLQRNTDCMHQHRQSSGWFPLVQTMCVTQKHHKCPYWSHNFGFLPIRFKEVSTVNVIVGGIY